MRPTQPPTCLAGWLACWTCKLGESHVFQFSIASSPHHTHRTPHLSSPPLLPQLLRSKGARFMLGADTRKARDVHEETHKKDRCVEKLGSGVAAHKVHIKPTTKTLPSLLHSAHTPQVRKNSRRISSHTGTTGTTRRKGYRGGVCAFRSDIGRKKRLMMEPIQLPVTMGTQRIARGGVDIRRSTKQSGKRCEFLLCFFPF